MSIVYFHSYEVVQYLKYWPNNWKIESLTRYSATTEKQGHVKTKKRLRISRKTKTAEVKLWLQKHAQPA